MLHPPRKGYHPHISHYTNTIQRSTQSKHPLRKPTDPSHYSVLKERGEGKLSKVLQKTVGREWYTHYWRLWTNATIEATLVPFMRERLCNISCLSAAANCPMGGKGMWRLEHAVVVQP